eukprot:179964_1
MNSNSLTFILLLFKWQSTARIYSREASQQWFCDNREPSQLVLYGTRQDRSQRREQLQYTSRCNIKLMICNKCDVIRDTPHSHITIHTNCYIYKSNVTIQGHKGPQSAEFDQRKVYSNLNAQLQDLAISDALSQFWNSFYQSSNLSCNCVTENITEDGCDIQIKTCWKIYSDGNHGYEELLLTTGGKFESWASVPAYTGHARYTETTFNSSKLRAISDLRKNYPSCFTSNPTHDPTTAPTLYPTADPTLSPSCEGCELFDGVHCLSGYQPYGASNVYCEPCPDGTAGESGICHPCKDGEEPTFDRISCERKPQETKQFLLGIASGIIVTVMGGLLLWYIRTKCCEGPSKLGRELVNNESSGDEEDNVNNAMPEEETVLMMT